MKHARFLTGGMYVCICEDDFSKEAAYDFFISHSSKDSASVQKLIQYENQKGKYFCDGLMMWII